MGGYTVGELERDTGFSRRTIAYYVQLGLLPRVGRLGPKTRYPEQVRDRLRFIRRVREAQEAGEVPPVSLSDIREVFERAPPSLISRVADGRTAVTREIFSSPDPALSSPSRRHAALQDRLMVMEEAAPYLRESVRENVRPYRAEPPARSAPAADAPAADEPELPELLAALAETADSRAIPGSSVEAWSRIRITPDIVVSVRGVAEEDSELLETLGRELRRLIRLGQDSMS